MNLFKMYLKIARQNIGNSLLYLFIFLGVTVIFSKAAAADSNSVYEPGGVKIGIVNAGESRLAESLQICLEKTNQVSLEKNDKEKLWNELYDWNLEYIIWIPDEFMDTCVREQAPLETTSVSGSYNTAYIDQQINQFLNQAAVYAAAGFSEEETAEALENMELPEVKLLQGENGNEFPEYGFYFQYAPYLFLGALSYAIGHILLAVNARSLPRRMRASCVSVKRQILEGILAVSVIGLILWGVVMLCAFFIYGESFRGSGKVLYYALNLFALLIVCITVGFLVGTLAGNRNSLSGLANLVSLGMCFLCGVFVSIDSLSEKVLNIAKFLPVYWYETASGLLGEAGAVDSGVQIQIWMSVGIQLAFAAAFICVTLAVGRTRSQSDKIHLQPE